MLINGSRYAEERTVDIYEDPKRKYRERSFLTLLDMICMEILNLIFTFADHMTSIEEGYAHSRGSSTTLELVAICAPSCHMPMGVFSNLVFRLE